ncbi:MAG: response regulator transcription factor [Desulfobulbaceae bacterium]|nr:response regulator transcription factor [Desulfobulbaceae bacterium]HIJ78770.1 response regulator transcription factor [Deltaproteobacteria bacterium]
MGKEHIIIIEDDENIQQLVGYNLAKAGFTVSYADNGEQGLALIRSEKPNLVVLDIMLPGLNGLELCKAVRQDPAIKSTPILMLTAKSEESDVAAGLDIGADDYITKPFSPKILLSRVKAALRRQSAGAGDAKGQADASIKVHDILINAKRHEVTVAGAPITLTITEYSILELLAKHPGWVFSRQQIIDSIRGYAYVITPRAVDVQVFGLRKKLGESGQFIDTVRGIGYRLRD